MTRLWRGAAENNCGLRRGRLSSVAAEVMFYEEAGMEISGSCFCKAVQFKASGTHKSVVNCHCNICRKQSGAAFSTYVAVPEDAFEIISGADSISSFQMGEGAHKHFCRECGSPVFNKNARYPGLSIIYLGGISDVSNLTPTANIYCESQLAWVSSIADLRSFEQGIGKQAKH
jgi:hypothetical protein